MSFRIGETVQVNDKHDGVVLGKHEGDPELVKVWFDDFGDWKYMLESELKSIDALQAELAAALERAKQAEARVKELSSRMAVLLQWEDSVKVIKGIPYPKTLEINIDWIEKHYEQSPIATGMVLGDLLDLFEERLGELTVSK